ncbi:MAG: hypothetical protein HRU17_19605 [Polyangiaceae bacterium]|nr:hypothetical protein [Polyangiaceae bacterium]
MPIGSGQHSFEVSALGRASWHGTIEIPSIVRKTHPKIEFFIPELVETKNSGAVTPADNTVSSSETDLLNVNYMSPFA